MIALAPSPFMSVEELCALLHLSERQLYRRLREREAGVPLIPHRRVGRRFVFHRGEIERWMRDGRLWDRGQPTDFGEGVHP